MPVVTRRWDEPGWRVVHTSFVVARPTEGVALGLFDLIGLAGILIFALPLAIFGIEQLLAGDVAVGGGLVVVAALMVIIPHRLTTPGDVPAAAAERAVGALVPDDED